MTEYNIKHKQIKIGLSDRVKGNIEIESNGKYVFVRIEHDNFTYLERFLLIDFLEFKTILLIEMIVKNYKYYILNKFIKV